MFINAICKSIHLSMSGWSPMSSSCWAGLFHSKCISKRLACCRACRLTAISGTIILVPCPVLKSLQSIWRSGTHRWNLQVLTQIAKFMGTTWGPPGSCWSPCWPHEPCYQGIFKWVVATCTKDRTLVLVIANRLTCPVTQSCPLVYVISYPILSIKPSIHLVHRQFSIPLKCIC